MAINYPTSLDDTTSLPTRTTGDTIPVVDTNDPKSAIIQLETKLGTGASTPTTSGHVLRVTGAGATAYGAVAQADVTNLTTDLAAKVPTTRTVNSHALSADISLTASDVGAVPTSRTVNGKALSANIVLSGDDVLPTQTGNNGKFLMTDGTNSSWGTPAGGGGGGGWTLVAHGTDFTTTSKVITGLAGDTDIVYKLILYVSSTVDRMYLRLSFNGVTTGNNYGTGQVYAGIQNGGNTNPTLGSFQPSAGYGYIALNQWGGSTSMGEYMIGAKSGAARSVVGHCSDVSANISGTDVVELATISGLYKETATEITSITLASSQAPTVGIYWLYKPA